MKDIWAQWDDEARQLFFQTYGDISYLLDIMVDRHLFRAMGYRAYVRLATLPTFTKKLVMITGMSEQWAIARVQQKGDSKGIPWTVLRILILTHPDVKKRVDVLALSIYSMIIFPKALGHIDEAVADLFNRLGKQNTPVPAILAEMIRSLSTCRRASEKLEKVPCRVFFEGYSPLKKATTTSRRDDIIEERWMDILHNLREEEVLWKAPWMTPNEVLYRCGSFDWVPLPGIWGVIGYAPLLVLKKYKAGEMRSSEYSPSKHDKRKLVVHGGIHDIIARDSSQQRRDERKPKVHEGIHDLIANEDYPRAVVVGNIALEEGKIAKLELDEETKQDFVETIMEIQKCGPKTHTGGFAIARINMRFWGTIGPPWKEIASVEQ
ncbi:hypothetical protein CXB51_024468 [Gossypium anomalum]|uniref:DUF7745 domain-containing protein n=1 Tax=Gossypium anomalum TaxID=47600 RepID=A0A8J5YPU0_9ROSI|nr:hypothetical protein CXB51_024468 [Gossypium anomalum]